MKRASGDGMARIAEDFQTLALFRLMRPHFRTLQMRQSRS